MPFIAPRSAIIKKAAIAHCRHTKAHVVAVDALSTARATAGKSDVVLMRWGTDPWPRLINIRTGIDLAGELGAAFSNEFLALSWAEKAADGSLHRKLVTMDTEDIKVPEPKDLGQDDGSTLPVQAQDKVFNVDRLVISRPLAR